MDLSALEQGTVQDGEKKIATSCTLYLKKRGLDFYGYALRTYYRLE